ncbi:MAG: choice-of-anchor Q domain-containing protein [Ferruginibacter sp.]
MTGNNGAGKKIAFRNCIVKANTAANSAGGMYNELSSPFIASCIFTDNHATGGGGTYNDAGGAMLNYNNASPAIVNSLFTANSSTRCGGVFSWSSCSPVFNNCTFSGNSTVTTGSSLYSEVNTSVTVANSIFWNNSGGQNIYNDNTSATAATYSDVQGGYTGTGNLNMDPLFVIAANPAGSDNSFGTADDGLRLLTGSPALDAGSNTNLPAGITTDIAGAARIQNSMVDMGAYENTVSTLPLKLLQFEGTLANDKNAVLSWRTAAEINTSYFELQRSTDGRSFSIVATVQAKGTTSGETEYSYTDKSLAEGVYYYRLRMVDKDGRETYSPVITVKSRGQNAITLYPVPAKDFIWLSGGTTNFTGSTAILMDMRAWCCKTFALFSGHNGRPVRFNTRCLPDQNQ